MSTVQPTRLKGFMIDAARGPEPLAQYRKTIAFCAEWGFNAIIFRLTDDQGSALRFRGHPELRTFPNALTTDDTRGLIEYAGERGIELIPEIQSFGHCRYITDVAAHRELFDGLPGEYLCGLNPVHPGTRALLEDLYREAAAIFPSRFLHGGCDEVEWGHSELSRAALRTRSKSEIWAEHLNGLNRIARRLGKELMIWGDYVLRADPAALPLLDKEIIIHDWKYDVFDPAEIAATAQRAIDCGLRVIGGPALMWCRWGTRPGRVQLDNINAFAEAYRRLDPQRALGVIVTNWLPTRFVPNSILDGMAYAGVALEEGSAQDWQAHRRFVERHFGATWNSTWADAFKKLYEIAPCRPGYAHEHGYCAIPPWSNAAELQQARTRAAVPLPEFERVCELLRACAPAVRKNQADFEALCVGAEYLAHVDWRDNAVRQQIPVSEIAERDGHILLRLEAHCRPLYGDYAVEYEPFDMVLDVFRKAAAFSARLAQQAEPACEVADR